MRGSILEEQGRGGDAVPFYEAAIRANPSDAQARASLAGLAMGLRRYDLAKPQFETLIKMGYRPSRMHFGLAQIAEAAGDTKTAATEYRAALQFEPTLTQAKAALSRLGQ